MTEKQKQALERNKFKPGQTGNAGGRPGKRPITDRYFEQLTQVIPANLVTRFNRSCHAKLLQVGDTWGKAIAVRACYEAVFAASIRAMREMREAIEGKSPMRLEITGPERKEITIVIKHDRESDAARNRRYESMEVNLGEIKPM